MTDPIVAEVRRARDLLAAKFNYDLDAIVRDARQRQEQSKRKVVSLNLAKPQSRNLSDGSEPIAEN